MKKIFKTVLGLTTIVAALSITSCKKSDDNSTPSPVTSTDDQKNQSSDQSAFSEASNETMNSANSGLASNSAARAAAGSIAIVANADVKLNLTKDTLTVDFKGDNEDATRTRSGKMYVYLSNKTERWYTQGAKWTIDYGTGVTVTRKADGKKVKLTGTLTVVNRTGGNVYAAIGASDSVAHQIDGTLKLTFDNETTAREWTVSRIRTVAKAGAAYRITFIGNGANTAASGNFNNVSEYGTTRFGTAFTATIDKPLVLENCGGKYKIVAGVVTHHRLSKDITVSYGVNSSGAVAATPCDASAMKVTFVNSVNTTVDLILGL